jgi:cobyrinic acid a,c-diamide synthase
MSADRIVTLAGGHGMLVIEGAMGLFDGAPPDGKGSTADLARLLGLPVILIVDASRMAQSIAPLVAGFARHDPAVRVAGVILNRVSSARHAAMLARALTPLGLPVLGSLPRVPALAHPSRHLGLVQAEEREDLEAFLEQAADLAEAHLDIAGLLEIARSDRPGPAQGSADLSCPPPAQTIAIARDAAFSFAYPHLLAAWQAAGATLSFFSPLADDPVPKADLVYLPGGYPELHASRIAASSAFMSSLRLASQLSDIYGECGGYMVLGNGLTDADGQRHQMAGLVRLETSFRDRKLHLGYRKVQAASGVFQGQWTAHEFHYATTTRAEGQPLFDKVTDAEGSALPAMGLRQGRVSGSFAHLIDRL